MHRKLWKSVVLAMVASLAAWAQADPDVIPDRYIVVLRDNVPASLPVAAQAARLPGVALLHVYEHALKGFSATIPAGQL